LSLSNAVPAHVLDQDAVLDVAQSMFGHRMRNFDLLIPIFENTGIKTRYSACPIEWFFEPRDWPQRTAVYIEAAQDLFRRAATEALEQAGLAAKDIDTIVTVSSTGVATPTIEARTMFDMGFRHSVNRLPVFGLGCAGGVTGLATASRLAAGRPGSNILLVVVELCTLAFRHDELTKANIVATALFGDGAAAAVVSAGAADGLARFEHAGEHTWPDTLSIMGWRIDPIGFSAIFDRSIPDLVRSDLRPVADAFLSRHGLRCADLGGHIFHPGGTKVIEALEEVFDLQQGELNKEREVLASNGNMSAPTVMFVLKRALESGVSGRQLISSLGPGFTASFATVNITQPA